jgi:ubiquitin-protein ligase
MLCDPNPNSALNSESADLFKNDRKRYDEKAREWTEKHAME